MLLFEDGFNRPRYFKCEQARPELQRLEAQIEGESEMIKPWVLYFASILMNTGSVIFLPKGTLEYSTVIILAFMLMCTGFILAKLEQVK